MSDPGLQPGIAEAEIAEVTVVSIFYNRAAAVQASVRSLLDQTRQNLRFVLVDDGSVDGTLQELMAVSSNDERVEVRTQANMGFTASLCAVFETMSSPFVALHDAGDISAPDRMQRQVDLLESDPSLVAVGCWYEVVDEESGRSKLVRPSIPVHRQTEYLLDTNPFSHGEVMIRRYAYDAVGGYRSFFWYSQDRDLWLRLSEVGKLGVVPELLYTRLRFRDSVSVVPALVLQQQLYAEYAKQCAEERRRRPDGTDWLDTVNGAGPGLFRRRSRRLARNLVRIAYWAAIRTREPDFASVCIEMSRAEGLTMSNMFCRPIIWGACRLPRPSVLLKLRGYWSSSQPRPDWALLARQGLHRLLPVRARIALRRVAPGRRYGQEEWQSLDALLVSFPKSGRTWLRLMLGRALQCHFGIDCDEPPLDLEHLAGHDTRVPRVRVIHDGRKRTRPPQLYRGKRVILLVRDPRDILVSLYYERHFRQRTFDGTLDEFVDDHRNFKEILDFMSLWESGQYKPEAKEIVKYEDLRAYPHHTLERLLSFLGVSDIAHEVIDEAVEYASFANMRKIEQSEAVQSDKLRPGDVGRPESYKTRRGKVGGYRDELTHEQTSALEQRMQSAGLRSFGYTVPSRQ